MLTVYRSNRAEFLAELLAAQLRLQPPGPFEQVQVVVNTWPTSRWLGEQLAVGLGGIAANLRFPFPGSQLRQIVNAVLGDAPGEQDPWRANQLVWPVLELLGQLVERPEGELLHRWLERRGGVHCRQLELARWQLGRAIADALDDYALYRPELLAAWWHGRAAPPLPAALAWQPLLVQLLRQRLGQAPFGVRVLAAIERLEQQPPPASVAAPLRLFGLSSLAPIQVRLLQALAAHRPVELYLLTPCRDLWQRCSNRRQELSDLLALRQPLAGEWLLTAPGLEGRFGRLGAEFQQLLEGTGETELGQWEERDLFFAAASQHRSSQPTAAAAAPLLKQIQQHLADPDTLPRLGRGPGDDSLEFHSCPGRLRQVQIVRDRILQLLAADPSLEPRDVLVMTPQVDAYAPLLAAVFGDSTSTGVRLDWRLTDRSQQGAASIASGLLQLLALAGERFTASALEALLECQPLQQRFGLEGPELAALHLTLQRAGFRWGLDGGERGGSATGSLSWAIDRLLLGLVLPETPGLAPADTAPLACSHDLELQGRWLHLLCRLRHWLRDLRRPRTVAAWAPLLIALIDDLFGEGGEQAWERPQLLAAIDDWQQAAVGCALELAAPVVGAVLQERLNADSGRFGHRSGALTISALEPMRAIPHRVVVLMGLEAAAFPRQRQRPGFHLLEHQRQLGDPNPADQDRYALLEAVLSARDHLLVSWSSREERRGEALPPATPVRQWLAWLQEQLGAGPAAGLLVQHPASALAHANFLPQAERPPASCDRRLLQARQLLDQPQLLQPPRPLAFSPWAEAPPPPGPTEPDDLPAWLEAPQRCWLRALGLRPREWAEPLADLEQLQLQERQRSLLLGQALVVAGFADDFGYGFGNEFGNGLGGDAPPLAEPEGWLLQARGRGILPAEAAGVLEAVTLSERWRAVQNQLEGLGPRRQNAIGWGPWQRVLLWAGDSVVQLRAGRDRSRHRLTLWFDLLLAAAAGEAPRQGVLIARTERGMAPALRLRAPECDAARRELERLAALREDWRHRCWPVPPETGWALLDRGEAAAIGTWEGSAQRPGERLEPEQALCFGAELGGRELLAGTGADLRELADALLAPLLEQRP